MRPSDSNRIIGKVLDSERKVSSLLGNPVNHQTQDTDLKNGSAMVLHAMALGKGCVCDVEVLSQGQSSGIAYHDAVCHSSLLSVGSVVSFHRCPDGTIELIAGGGSSTPATTTTNNITIQSQDTYFIFGGFNTPES